MTRRKKHSTTFMKRPVLTNYRDGSLAELHAVLGLYNVVADSSEKNSTTERNNGLIYRVLDEKGNKTGVPIKASSIYNRPTLEFLKQKFEVKKRLKEPHRRRLQSTIDWILLRPCHSVRSLLHQMVFGRLLPKQDCEWLFQLRVNFPAPSRH